MPLFTYGTMIWAFTKIRHSLTGLSCFKKSRCFLCDNLETSTRMTCFKECGETQLLQPLAYSPDYWQKRSPDLQNKTAGLDFCLFPAFSLPCTMTITFHNITSQTVSRIPSSLDAKVTSFILKSYQNSIFRKYLPESVVERWKQVLAMLLASKVWISCDPEDAWQY